MERIDRLLAYLHELQKLEHAGHNCHREIDEAIAEIRDELRLAGREKSIVRFKPGSGMYDGLGLLLNDKTGEILHSFELPPKMRGMR